VATSLPQQIEDDPAAFALPHVFHGQPHQFPPAAGTQRPVKDWEINAPAPWIVRNYGHVAVPRLSTVASHFMFPIVTPSMVLRVPNPAARPISSAGA